MDTIQNLIPFILQELMKKNVMKGYVKFVVHQKVISQRFIWFF